MLGMFHVDADMRNLALCSIDSRSALLYDMISSTINYGIAMNFKLLEKMILGIVPLS
jgi:hypothetical protein